MIIRFVGKGVKEWKKVTFYHWLHKKAIISHVLQSEDHKDLGLWFHISFPMYGLNGKKKKKYNELKLYYI